MTRRIRSGLLLCGVVLLASLLLVFHPRAQEVEESETPTVSESDLQMYIKIYSAMQDDHDLMIDNAIKPYQISLDDFRQTERRIQNEPRLVERVRQALLDHAKEHSVFAQTIPTPAKPVTPPAKKEPHKKK